jgi:putative peptidoglycan lipid II flippase
MGPGCYHTAMASFYNGSIDSAPENKKLYKSGFFVALALFASKGIGYLREIILAYFFGTGALVDAFRIALTAVLLPTNILAGSALQNSIIPVFQGFLSQNKKRIAWIFANQLFFVLVGLGLVLFVLEYFFAEKWVYLLAPGFNAEQAGHAVFFTRLMSFSVPLMMACSIAFILNCFYVFKVPSLRAPIQNIFVLAGILLTVYRGKFEFMGAAFPVAYLIFFVMLAISIRKYWEFRFTPMIRRSLKIWSQFMPVWLPLFGMMLVGQLNVYIDRLITSLLSEGSIAALEYSRFLVETPGITLGIGFMSVFLPYFSALSARDDTAALSRNIEHMITLSVYIMLPVSLVLFISGEEIIELLFGYGKFDKASVSLTASALKGYSIGVWAYFLYIPVSKYYQAVKRNVALLISFTVSLGVNIVLNLLLYKPYGIAGIAVATSISQILLFILLFMLMGLIDKKKLGGNILYMCVSVSVAGLIAWRMRLLFDGHIARIAVVLGTVAASWLLFNLGIKEIREKTTNLLRRKGKGDSV